MNAVIPIMARRKKLIRTFKKAGATSRENAIDTYQYGIRESLIFNKLVREKVFIKTNDHNFYLDEQREAELTKLRRKIIFTILMVIGLVALLTSIFANR